MDDVMPTAPAQAINAGRRLLIVDDSRDSREVLRAVLELRGWNIIEADDASDGLEKAESLHPDVILLDADTAGVAGVGQADYTSASERHNASLVVIGRATLPTAPGDRQRVVSKPYHYGPLVRTIDELAAGMLAKAS